MVVSSTLNRNSQIASIIKVKKQNKNDSQNQESVIEMEKKLKRRN